LKQTALYNIRSTYTVTPFSA